VIPNKVQAWIQIHKTPPLYRTKVVLNQLAGRVGEVLALELRVVSHGGGNFHRAKVNLLATKPLPRVVILAPEGCDKMMRRVKYEELPHFCSHCGLMGHVYLECGTREQAEEDLQFGSWMIADEAT
jgi:hypothetical protein